MSTKSTVKVTPLATKIVKAPEVPIKAPRVSLSQYIRNIKTELAKVSWPTAKETKLTTMMVFAMVIISAIFFFVVDQLLAFGIKIVLNLGA